MSRIGVLTFPGSLDQQDALRAVRLAGGNPVPLWHKDTGLDGVDAVIIPGGFSYGDYLRSGAIAARTPMIKAIVEEAEKGLPVLGICNGFQILTETGLLPGGLIRNARGVFVCRDQELRVTNTDTFWTSGYIADRVITLPLKNGEGSYIADEETLKEIEGEGLVAFRYHGTNPNGSLNDIAGLTNVKGNVVGLMPHPEHAIEPGFGPDTEAAMRSGVDGLTMFETAIASLVNA